MTDTAICAQHLSKKYADRGSHPGAGFDLTVSPGIVLSLLGPNDHGESARIHLPGDLTMIMDGHVMSRGPIQAGVPQRVAGC